MIGGCWKETGVDFGGTGGGPDEIADKKAGEVEDNAVGREVAEIDDEGAITGADESGDWGSKGAGRDGEKTVAGGEE